MTDTPFTLPLEACVRSVCINQDTPHAFLLGAGASIQSGVPDAITCIWLWKRAIVCTSYLGCEDQFQDLTQPDVQAQLQCWLDDQGDYPPAGAPEEYSFYVEQCYPILEDRQQYFQHLAEQARPSVGYHLLGVCLTNVSRGATAQNREVLALRFLHADCGY